MNNRNGHEDGLYITIGLHHNDRRLGDKNNLWRVDQHLPIIRTELPNNLPEEIKEAMDFLGITSIGRRRGLISVHIWRNPTTSAGRTITLSGDNGDAYMNGKISEITETSGNFGHYDFNLNSDTNMRLIIESDLSPRRTRVMKIGFEENE